MELIDSIHSSVMKVGPPVLGEPPPTTAIATFRKQHPKVDDWTNLDFDSLDLKGVDFSGLDLSGSRWVGCRMSSARMTDAIISNCYLEYGTKPASFANANNAHFERSDLSNTRIELDLQTAVFNGAELRGTNLNHSDLRGAQFRSADLTSAHLCNVRANTLTNLESLSSCLNCTVDRYFLNSLGPKQGGLTIGNQSDLIITDDVIRLRSEFGGFIGLVHLVSLATFVVPYLWFVGSKYAISNFVQSEHGSKTMPLLEATLRFISTGGDAWSTSWGPNLTSLTCFFLVLFFNVVRGLLLWKTLSIERQEVITGIPARFSLDEYALSWKWIRVRWGTILGTMEFFFWLMLLSVIVNTIIFLQTPVSI